MRSDHYLPPHAFIEIARRVATSYVALCPRLRITEVEKFTKMLKNAWKYVAGLLATPLASLRMCRQSGGTKSAGRSGRSLG